MKERVAILSPGIWRQRRLIRACGLKLVRWLPPLRRPAFDCVAGWGRRKTTRKAVRLARQTGKPYMSIEDGWLRSICPGASELPLSLVFDRTGVHYDAPT